MLTQILESVNIMWAMLTQPLAVYLMLGRTSVLVTMAACCMLTQTLLLLLKHHKTSSRRQENQVLLHDLLHYALDTAVVGVLCALLCSHSLHHVQEMWSEGGFSKVVKVTSGYNVLFLAAAHHVSKCSSA